MHDPARTSDTARSRLILNELSRARAKGLLSPSECRHLETLAAEHSHRPTSEQAPSADSHTTPSE